MSILFRTRPRATTEQRAKLPDYIAAALRSADTSAGVFIDNDSAMRHDAVWSCVTKIAQDVSMMPVDVVSYGANGARREVNPRPRVIAAPSVKARPLDWRYQVMVSLLTAGNAWGLVTKTSPDMQFPERIELLNDNDVRVDMTNGELRFNVKGQERELWPVGDLWHLPAYTMPGTVLGLSPIAYHRAKIAAGLNAEQFGSDFFPNGAPSALLMPATDPGPEGAAKLKQRFREAQAGRDVVVLPQTVKYERIQINPSDSQFIETQRYTVEQICRVFGEDPADHGSAAGGGSQTYANRSDADLARYKRRQFWVTKMQDALGELVPESVVVKLNTSASLMMTARERHEISKLRLDSKTITVNEVRTIDDEAPFPWPEYDEPGIPSGSPDTPDTPDTPDMPELPDPEQPADPADPAADPPVEDEETT